MGHTEMRLAVAGLAEKDVEDRTIRLADAEWATFPPAERAAYRFAYKLTSEPWAVTASDVKELVSFHGRERALDAAWHVAWGNYMTRIADAFQLPLESANVFLSEAAPRAREH